MSIVQIFHVTHHLPALLFPSMFASKHHLPMCPLPILLLLLPPCCLIPGSMCAAPQHVGPCPGPAAAEEGAGRNVQQHPLLLSWQLY